MPDIIINREVYDDVIINTRFEEAKTRTNLTSGENLAISLGKVKKYLNDLGDAAFVDIDTELDDTSTNPVQNKVIAGAINQNSSDISSIKDHIVFSENSKTYYLQPEQPTNPANGDIWIG